MKCSSSTVADALILHKHVSSHIPHWETLLAEDFRDYLAPSWLPPGSQERLVEANTEGGSISNEPMIRRCGLFGSWINLKTAESTQSL